MCTFCKVTEFTFSFLVFLLILSTSVLLPSPLTLSPSPSPSSLFSLPLSFLPPSLSLSLSLSLLQLYKATVHNTVIEFIPLTMNAIILQPSPKARQATTFNKEIYVDFLAVQIKFLSFLAYIIRIYQVICVIV